MLCNTPRKLSKHTEKRHQSKRKEEEKITHRCGKWIMAAKMESDFVKSPKGKPTLAGFGVIVQSNADSAAVVSAVLPDDVTSA